MWPHLPRGPGNDLRTPHTIELHKTEPCLHVYGGEPELRSDVGASLSLGVMLGIGNSTLTASFRPVDNLDYTDTNVTMPFSMSGDKVNDVTIPAVFMHKDDATWLMELIAKSKNVMVLLTWLPSDQEEPPADQNGEPLEDEQEDVLPKQETRESEFEEKVAELDKPVLGRVKGEDGMSDGSLDKGQCHGRQCEEDTSTSSLYDNGFSSDHNSLENM